MSVTSNIKLADILDYLRDFADTDPTQEDWEIIGNMVDSFLDERDYHYVDEDWLPEEEEDEGYFNVDKNWRGRVCPW
jgi:hypothetical protein